MFTGLVEAVGTVRQAAPRGAVWELAIAAPGIRPGLAVGDSLSVSGACLTVEALEPGGFRLALVPETVARTHLGSLRPGDRVNLERALAADGRLGGHIVQGHVDAVGRVVAVTGPEAARRLRFQAPPELLALVVPKGFVAVDGASLTVVDVDDAAGTFGVAFVPHTLAQTVAGGYRPGDAVNLEADILGKYVARLLAAGAPSWAPGRSGE